MLQVMRCDDVKCTCSSLKLTTDGCLTQASGVGYAKREALAIAALKRAVASDIVIVTNVVV